jgi:hypothetical protein
VHIYKALILIAPFSFTNSFAQQVVDEKIKTFDSGVSHIKRVYQDWTTTKIVDELEPDFEILICTNFTKNKSEYDNGRSRLCFRFYSSKVIIVEPQAMNGKGFWPHCDYDRITFKVDNAKPSTIPTQQVGGSSCGDNLDITNQTFINEWKSGKGAKLKIHYSRGIISLNGFSEAITYTFNEYEYEYD